MNHQDKETRRQRRLEKLGTNHPCCVVCGESYVHCLEEHHIGGQYFDDQLSIVCRNCHRKLSDDQKDHPQKLIKSPTQLECIGHFLLGLADLLALIVEKLKAFGTDLIDQAKELGTSK